jgi:hypothetical protein
VLVVSERAESEVDVRYGIAGKAAGEAALEHGRDGARMRLVTDAFVLSRIARAIVDALAEHDAAASARVEITRPLGNVKGARQDG